MDGLARGTKKMKGKDIAAEVVGLLMMSRTYAHLAHLKTGSYAKHVALNGFYDCVVGFADSIAEIAQGKFGIIDIPVIDVNENVAKPADGLEIQLGMIQKAAVGCEIGALKNILDEIEGLYLSTIYKLRELD